MNFEFTQPVKPPAVVTSSHPLTVWAWVRVSPSLTVARIGQSIPPQARKLSLPSLKPVLTWQTWGAFVGAGGGLVWVGLVKSPEGATWATPPKLSGASIAAAPPWGGGVGVGLAVNVQAQADKSRGKRKNRILVSFMGHPFCELPRAKIKNRLPV
jgi:hypothetical protein